MSGLLHEAWVIKESVPFQGMGGDLAGMASMQKHP